MNTSAAALAPSLPSVRAKVPDYEGYAVLVGDDALDAASPAKATQTRVPESCPPPAGLVGPANASQVAPRWVVAGQLTIIGASLVAFAVMPIATVLTLSLQAMIAEQDLARAGQGGATKNVWRDLALTASVPLTAGIGGLVGTLVGVRASVAWRRRFTPHLGTPGS